MANEPAVIIELLGDGGDPIRYSCNTAIPKGTLCMIDADRRVKACTADDDPIAGVAAMEADGTETSISVYTNGIFDFYSATGMTLGAIVMVDALNDVVDTDAGALLNGAVVGQAIEAAGAGATSAVRVLK